MPDAVLHFVCHFAQLLDFHQDAHPQILFGDLIDMK